MTVLTTTTVNVSWEKAPILDDLSIEYYTVLYGPEAEFEHKQNSMNSTEQHIVIDNMAESVTYEFQVFAIYIVNGTRVDGKLSTPLQFVNFGQFISHATIVCVYNTYLPHSVTENIESTAVEDSSTGGLQSMQIIILAIGSVLVVIGIIIAFFGNIMVCIKVRMKR